MNWKGRQMFSPINMTKGGGVPYPSYEGGGIIGATPRERKRMFTIWDKMTQGQKEKVMDGKRYQMGGEIMPTQLFEEGDQDINMALNNMVGTTSPSIGQLSEEVAISDEPMVEEPRTMDYETELFELKQDFYDDIMSYITQVQDMAQVEKYLKGIRIAYGEQLKKLKRKYDVADYMAEEELLTPDFLTEIQQVLSNEDALPGFQVGGLVIEKEQDLKDLGIGLSLIQWNYLDEETQKRYIQEALVRKSTGDTQTGTDYDMTRLDAVLKKARENAKAIGTAAGARKKAMDELYTKRLTPAQIRAIGTAAGGEAATKQGGIRGFVTQYNAAMGAEAAARDLIYRDEIENMPETQTEAEAKAMADILQNEIAREQAIATAGIRGTTSSNEPTAAAKNFMLLGKDPDITGGDLFKAGMKVAEAEGYDPSDHQNIAVIFMLQAGRQDSVNQTFPMYKGTREVTIGGQLGKATLMEFIREKQKEYVEPNDDFYANATAIINEWLRGSIVE